MLPKARDRNGPAYSLLGSSVRAAGWRRSGRVRATQASGFSLLTDMLHVSVAFVHGLNPLNREAYPYLAWTHEDGTFWPRDFLPRSCPNARILLFGYNSSVALGASKIHIHDHANELLDQLSHSRKSDKDLCRPIVFIAHSLGGLVVKQVPTTPLHCVMSL